MNLDYYCNYSLNMSLLVGVILATASLLINIIGLAIPYWLYNSVSAARLGIQVTIKRYQGLWSVCGSVSASGTSTSACNSISDVQLDAAYKATRAMEILGMLIILAAIVCILVKQFVMKNQPILLKIGALCALVAGLLMIIGTIIFATMDGVDSSKLHAGFALCIISGVVGIVAAIVIFHASNGE